MPRPLLESGQRCTLGGVYPPTPTYSFPSSRWMRLISDLRLSMAPFSSSSSASARTASRSSSDSFTLGLLGAARTLDLGKEGISSRDSLGGAGLASSSACPVALAGSGVAGWGPAGGG